MVLIVVVACPIFLYEYMVIFVDFSKLPNCFPINGKSQKRNTQTAREQRIGFFFKMRRLDLRFEKKKRSARLWRSKAYPDTTLRAHLTVLGVSSPSCPASVSLSRTWLWPPETLALEAVSLGPCDICFHFALYVCSLTSHCGINCTAYSWLVLQQAVKAQNTTLTAYVKCTAASADAEQKKHVYFRGISKIP